MTDREFVDKLNENCYCSAFLIQDDEGNEYEFDGLEMCQFGSFHNIIKIKKVTNDRDKWFPTLETQIEMLKEQIAKQEVLVKEYPIKYPEHYAKQPNLYQSYLDELNHRLKHMEQDLANGNREKWED